ncbi:hypothetical protein BRC98_05090, partial [Halobacteriales archaeon QS_7_68_65]
QITGGDVAHFVACEPPRVSNGASGERRDPRAVADGAVIGYVGGGVPEDDRGAVGALYVDPDRRGEGHASEASVSTGDEHSESSGGIGTRLFERELDALAERGATRVTIRVLAANTLGRSFYESRGFEVVETSEDDLFGETRAAVTYAREI